MRKLISTLLIVTTLFANLSWAADTHAEAWFGHGAVCAADWTLDNEGTGNTGACDHCCHGFFHIVGFTEQPVFAVPAADAAAIALFSYRYRSYSQLPLTPPPNA